MNLFEKLCTHFPAYSAETLKNRLAAVVSINAINPEDYNDRQYNTCRRYLKFIYSNVQDITTQELIKIAEERVEESIKHINSPIDKGLLPLYVNNMHINQALIVHLTKIL